MVAALHLSGERDQMAGASSNQHLPLFATADMIRVLEKSNGYHHVSRTQGPGKHMRSRALPGMMMLSLFGPQGT